MGKRGPKPTPTITLRERGSWLAGTRQNEPKLPVEAPDCPEWLSGEAKKEWDRLVPILLEAGVLTKADRMALVMLCKAWARYLQAERRVERDGITVKTQFGAMKPHPAIAIANAAWAQLAKACAMFGIDPADRSSIKAAPKPEAEDAEAEFFKGTA